MHYPPDILYTVSLAPEPQSVDDDLVVWHRVIHTIALDFTGPEPDAFSDVVYDSTTNFLAVFSGLTAPRSIVFGFKSKAHLSTFLVDVLPPRRRVHEYIQPRFAIQRKPYSKLFVNPDSKDPDGGLEFKSCRE